MTASHANVALHSPLGSYIRMFEYIRQAMNVNQGLHRIAQPTCRAKKPLKRPFLSGKQSNEYPWGFINHAMVIKPARA